MAIDYDPGAIEVNQQNRIKMMLANARREKQQAGGAQNFRMEKPEPSMR